MDFKDDSNLSDLRDLIGKPCKRRTLRGWIHVGTIESVMLKDDGIYVTVSSGVRGSRDQQFSIRDCKLEETKPDDAALEREAKRRDALENKKKEKKDAFEEALKIAEKFKVAQRLKSQSQNEQ